VDLEETQLELAAMASAFIQNEFLIKKRDREVYVGYAVELLKVSTTADNPQFEHNSNQVLSISHPLNWFP